MEQQNRLHAVVDLVSLLQQHVRTRIQTGVGLGSEIDHRALLSADGVLAAQISDERGAPIASILLEPSAATSFPPGGTDISCTQLTRLGCQRIASP